MAVNMKLCEELVHRFAEKGCTFGTAESLTAGLIAASVAQVSGASKVLMGGIISYDPRIKVELLDVEQEIVDTVGVVSKECALQMAEGAWETLGVDLTVSATGLAGPGGGTEETPVGTVFIGVTTVDETRVTECHFQGDRQSIREQTVEMALTLALEMLETL